MFFINPSGVGHLCRLRQPLCGHGLDEQSEAAAAAAAAPQQHHQQQQRSLVLSAISNESDR